MDGLKVDQSLFMRKAGFKDVVLRAAHVGGQVSLIGSKVTGKLDMNRLKVDQDLFMRDGAEFKEVILRGAHIGGQVSLIGSKVADRLNMESLEAGSYVLLGSGAEFDEPIVFIFAKLGGGLDLAGGTFKKYRGSDGNADRR